MPLPNNFSEWEHLQNQILRIHNKQVRDYFSDITVDDDLSTPRSSLRHACLMKDEDTATMSQLRLWLFEVTAGHAASFQPPIYGIPTDTYQQHVTFKPQIVLHFYEDADEVEAGFQPIRSEISFRLVNETSETVSVTQARALATKINTLFGSASGYRWHKGRIRCLYKEPDKGYNFILHSYSESEGKRVIEQILDIQSHTPNWDYLTLAQLANTPPTIPPSKQIYGKTRKIPRKRPVGYVRFRRAELHLWGMPKPVVLVDKTGRFRNALISPLRPA
jgi:hypothetical protein